ncbi:MAG: RipA family octameric membrane protein, partial [Candidatus Heimdallarchaeota archaeon]
QSIINWLHSIRSPIEDLFNEDILEKNQESLFKQYQLYVEMSDRISSRRSTMNNFFLSANSLFLVAIGILVSSNLIQWSALVFIVAILFTFSWWRLIKYYRELNKAKFEVINKIEEKLPAKGFTVEWEIKKTYKKPGKHSRISFGEMWIPKTLIVVYFVFLIIVLVWIFSNIQTLFSVWLM